MNAKLIPILIAPLIGVSAAMAADVDDSGTGLKVDDTSTGLKADGTSPGLKFYGSVSVGLFGANETARDGAKLHEYRDLDDGVIAGFDLKGRGSEDYIDAFAENIARKDQYIYLKGGRYESMKYQVYWNEIPHNLAFDARTPYAGVGSNTSAGSSILTATFPSTAGFSLNQQAPPAWNTFNFGYQRSDIGGVFELSAGSPWYIRADANEVRQDGTKLIAGASGTSPGNGFVDKPFPVDFKTTNVSLEGGYAEKKGQISVNLLHSQFANANPALKWTNPFMGGLADSTTLPADSQLNKVGMNGNLRGLPLDSTLAGRFTYARTTNNISIATSALNTPSTGVFQYNPTNPSQPNYNGDVVHETASLSLYSNPTKAIDTRLYWNYFKKDNRGGEVTFTGLQPGLTCGRIVQGATVINAGDCTTDALSYKTNEFGLDVGVRLTPTNRLVLGYQYVATDQNRVDYDSTKNNKASIEWRNTSLDWLTSRLKYTYTQRRSNFVAGAEGTSANDPEYLNRFIMRYDLADANLNVVKLALDVLPAERWDFGFEGVWARTDYKNTVLGRTDTDRQQYYFSVAYGDIATFRVLLFADVEFLKYDSVHRNISTVSTGTGAGINALPSGFCQTTFLNCYDPSTPDNTSNYNWRAASADRNQTFGLGAQWSPQERLKLSGSVAYAKTTGNTNIATPLPVLVAVPINTNDDTTKFSIYLRGTYTFSKRWDLTAGYAYERYRYSDIAYNGYQYLIAGAAGPNFNSTSTSYLSGAYAFTDYTVNMAYIYATYKF